MEDWFREVNSIEQRCTENNQDEEGKYENNGEEPVKETRPKETRKNIGGPAFKFSMHPRPGNLSSFEVCAAPGSGKISPRRGSAPLTELSSMLKGIGSCAGLHQDLKELQELRKSAEEYSKTLNLNELRKSESKDSRALRSILKP
jgi:hypothetical protein